MTGITFTYEASENNAGGGVDNTSVGLTLSGSGGAAGLDRLVILGGIADNSGTSLGDFDTVTIDGVAATRVGSVVRGANSDSNFNAFLTVYRAAGTSSATFNVTALVNMPSGQAYNFAVASYRLSSDAVLVDFDSHTVTITGPDDYEASLSINTVADGAAVGGHLGFNAGSPVTTWSGLTEDFDFQQAFTNDNFSCAHAATTTAEARAVTASTVFNSADDSAVTIALSFGPPTAGGVSATFGVTISPVTVSSNADLIVAGSLAQTIAAVTLAASADLLLKGQLAATIDPVTLASSADLLIAGQLGITLDPVTLAANGSLVVASGTGNVGVNLDPVTLASSGDLLIKGQLVATIDPVTLAAAGSITQPAITGTLNVTIGPVTLAAYGSETGIPAGGGNVPYWGHGAPEKKKKKYKAPPPPRREGGHIPTKALRKAVRELLALEAAKEAEKRRKPKALAKEIVEEIPAKAIAGLAKKEAISFVAKELRQELPQSFYSEQVIRDNEKLMRIILLILKRLLVLALLTQQAAEDEEEEELIALLFSAA